MIDLVDNLKTVADICFLLKDWKIFRTTSHVKITG